MPPTKGRLIEYFLVASIDGDSFEEELKDETRGRADDAVVTGMGEAEVKRAFEMYPFHLKHKRRGSAPLEAAEGALVPRIVDRYPQEDHADAPLDPMVACFALPILEEETFAAVRARPPDLVNFVLTNATRDFTYGASLVFHEPMKKSELARPKALCLLSTQAWMVPVMEHILLQLYRVAGFLILADPVEKYIHDLWREGSRCIWEFAEGKGDLYLRSLRFEPPSVDRLPPFNDADFVALFQCLSAENVLHALSAMLLECKIIVHSRRMGSLAPVCEALCALLFPFQWVGVYVPMVPNHSEFVSMLHEGVPVPFIFGVHSVCLKLCSHELLSTLVVIDLDHDEVLWPTDVEESVPQYLLPKSHVRQVQRALKRIVPFYAGSQTSSSGSSFTDADADADADAGVDVWHVISGNVGQHSPASFLPTGAKANMTATTSPRAVQEKKNENEENFRSLFQLWLTGSPSCTDTTQSTSKGGAQREVGAGTNLSWIDHARAAVLELFICMFGNYNVFMRKGIIDSAALLRAAPLSYRAFLEIFVSGNTWQRWVQDVEEHYVSGQGAQHHDLVQFNRILRRYAAARMVSHHAGVMSPSMQEWSMGWWQLICRPPEGVRQSFMADNKTTVDNVPALSGKSSMGHSSPGLISMYVQSTFPALQHISSSRVANGDGESGTEQSGKEGVGAEQDVSVTPGAMSRRRVSVHAHQAYTAMTKKAKGRMQQTAPLVKRDVAGELSVAAEDSLLFRLDAAVAAPRRRSKPMHHDVELLWRPHAKVRRQYGQFARAKVHRKGKAARGPRPWH
eukprot:g3407.t1